MISIYLYYFSSFQKKMLMLLVACLLPVLAIGSPCCTPGTWEGDVGLVMGTLDNGTTMTIEVLFVFFTNILHVCFDIHFVLSFTLNHPYC